MAVPKHVFFTAALLILGTLVLSGTSRGIMRKVEIPEMVQRAGTIVHGTVLSNECKMADDGTIYTYTTITVVEELTGSSSQGTITIRNMGGEIDAKGLRVSDVPTFEPGEEVFLFIEPEPRVEETELVGWEQGKFTARDGIIERTGQSVEDFRAEIRTLLTRMNSEK